MRENPITTSHIPFAHSPCRHLGIGALGLARWPLKEVAALDLDNSSLLDLAVFRRRECGWYDVVVAHGDGLGRFAAADVHLRCRPIG